MRLKTHTFIQNVCKWGKNSNDSTVEILKWNFSIAAAAKVATVQGVKTNIYANIQNVFVLLSNVTHFPFYDHHRRRRRRYVCWVMRMKRKKFRQKIKIKSILHLVRQEERRHSSIKFCCSSLAVAAASWFCCNLHIQSTFNTLKWARVHWQQLQWSNSSCIQTHTHAQNKVPIQMQIHKTKATKRLYSETRTKCKYREKTRFEHTFKLRCIWIRNTLFYRIENVCSNKIASISKAKKRMWKEFDEFSCPIFFSAIFCALSSFWVHDKR